MDCTLLDTAPVAASACLVVGAVAASVGALEKDSPPNFHFSALSTNNAQFSFPTKRASLTVEGCFCVVKYALEALVMSAS